MGTERHISTMSDEDVNVMTDFVFILSKRPVTSHSVLTQIKDSSHMARE